MAAADYLFVEFERFSEPTVPVELESLGRFDLGSKDFLLGVILVNPLYYKSRMKRGCNLLIG